MTKSKNSQLGPALKRFWSLALLILTVGLVLQTTPVEARPVSDLFGRSLNWPQTPKRIISLSPATTEMAFAVGAGTQVVGVTQDCNYPPQARNKKQVGRFGAVQLEALVKLQPDLILVTADMKKVLTPLQRLKVPVLGFSTSGVAQIGNNLKLLGAVTGHLQAGQTAAENMQKRLKQIQKRIPKDIHPSVFYLLWDQPLISAGPQSFIGDVLRLAGAHNSVPSVQAPFPHISLEHLIKADPEVMILPETVAGRVQLQRMPFNRLQAVKKGRILKINDDLISRPAPRVLDALEQIVNFLYVQK
jgi:iron complex transport system substrate-binding protein